MSEYPRIEHLSWLEGNAFLLDLETGRKIPLLGKTRDETVSPNGKWVAYYDASQEKIIVADYDGNLILELPSPHRRLEPRYWLDDQHLVLDDWFSLDPEYDFKDPYVILITLNPFTGEQKEWWPSDFSHSLFPNIFGGPTEWPAASELMFAPDMTHLAYSLELPAQRAVAVVLWDMREQKEISRVYTSYAPIWSPDSGQFAISAIPTDLGNFNDGLPYENGSDLYTMDIQGKLRRLTYFSIVPRQSTMEEGYTWSPNGRKIAFWMLDRLHSRSPSLAVVTVESKALVSYCATDETLPESQMAAIIFPPHPIWSPDGQYIAITVLNQDFGRKVLLVELASGKAWKIAENVSAMGWMVSEP